MPRRLRRPPGDRRNGRAPRPGMARPGSGTPNASVATNPHGFLSPTSFLGWLTASAAVYDGRAFTSQPGTADAYLWGHPKNRRFRYSLFWALYEATVFERLHRWADQLRHHHALPPQVESLYSPANRVGEFWADHVWGGQLDPDAGDGKGRPSALPVETHNPALRRAIAHVWRLSNWQGRKDTAPLYGAVLGDVFLAVNDDPRRQSATVEVHHPAYYRDLSEDARGNVRGYVFEEVVPDPRWSDVAETAPPVTRMVVCDRVGQGVRYRTYLDGTPYDWGRYEEGERPVGDEWVEDYGFVPLVKVQHRDRNLGWGFSELQPTRGRMLALDGVVSKLCEQLHKAVDAPRLYKGMTGPADIVIDLGDPDGDGDVGPWDDRPARGESRYPALYTPNAAAGTEPLYSLQDLGSGLALADALLARIVEAHPELVADVGDTGTNPSGVAIQKAREKVERRVAARRAGYDAALVRAQQMAVSIGGAKGYPGFEGFDAGSYAAGALDHAIGDRPVFATDESARLDLASRRSVVLKTLREAGVPLAVAMGQAGFTPDAIDAALRERDASATGPASPPAPEAPAPAPPPPA